LRCEAATRRHSATTTTTHRHTPWSPCS
jgi:hypothetical protein